MKLSCATSAFFFLLYIHHVQPSSESVRTLEPGDVYVSPTPGLQTYCHNAKSKYLVHLWKTLIVDIRTDVETYELYEGKTPREVKQKHEDNKRSWRLSFFGTVKNKQFKINPFEDVCIGVYTQMLNKYEYEISLTQLRIDPWKVTITALGMLFFWFAKPLSKNSLFYYLCGMVLGVTTSLIFLLYFIGKLFPKGKLVYVTLFTGCAMSFYIAQLLLDNIQLILMQYKEWVVYYILGTSLLSFLVCYRLGPVTNVRTKNIIQWFLQGIGLFAIYQSSYFTEASTSMCVLTLLAYNFPISLFNRGQRYWKKMFPPRRKLLSDDQFREEGLKETNKALSQLREFCSSPESNPWKTVLRLKQPIRFAQFVEGNSHLSDNETEEHDLEITKLVEDCEFTDDEADY